MKLLSFFLFRYLKVHVYESYLPTGIAVCVSWISFIIDPDIIPARSGSLITLLLILVNLSISIIGQSPAVNSHNALMTWSYMCIGMVSTSQKQPENIPNMG